MAASAWRRRKPRHLVERRQTRVWLTAALAAVAWMIVAAGAIWWSAPRIAADLQSRAQAALASAHFDTVTVSIDGRTAQLSGYAQDDKQRADAVGAVAAVWGIASVVDGIQSGGAAASPELYRFGAIWDGRSISLTGFMPTRETRDDISRQARDTLPGAELVDGLQVAPGAPDANWPAIAAAGIAAMKTLSSASLTIVGTKVTFKGTARMAADRAAAVDIMSRLPAPYATSIDIGYGDATTAQPAAATTAPSYRFSAAYDGISVALTGSVPSKAVLTFIRTALGEALPGVKIDDRTTAAPGAPDGAWADAVALALGEFAGMKSALLELDGSAMAFRAMAPSTKARDAAFAAFINLPAAYPATLEVAVAGGDSQTKTFGGADTPAATCQAAFSAALAETPIVFASSSSKVPDAAEPLIAKMAEIAGKCPNARLEVAGHTDASGSAATNIRLSFQRAGAVLDALSKAGVDSRRLSAKGYGSDRPVAANDNDAGKARNRRIEVIVRP